MDSHEFVMVSEWMENGNINEFIKTHTDVNRFELVRLLFPRCPHALTMNFSRSSKTPLVGLNICTIGEWYTVI